MTIRKCRQCQNDLENGVRVCPVCGTYNRLKKVVEKWVVVCHKCRRATEVVNGKMPRLCRCGSFLSEPRDEKMKWEEYLLRQNRDHEKRNEVQLAGTLSDERPGPSKRNCPELVLICSNEAKRITLRASGDKDEFLLGRGGNVDQEFFSKYQYKSLSDIPIKISYKYVGWYLKANADGEVFVPNVFKEDNKRFPKDWEYNVSDGDYVWIGDRLGFKIQIGQGS